MQIRSLSFPFTKNGWTHELVGREGPVLLVRRHKHGLPAHYEVIVARERQEETFQRGGREIRMPYREVYPSTEDWGTYGFTYTPGQCGSPEIALAQAHTKFESLRDVPVRDQVIERPG